MLLLLQALAILADSAAPPAEGWLEREAYLMGTTLRVAADLGPWRDPARLEPAFAEVRRLEASLSTWRAGTELADLNRMPVGRPSPLSPATYDLLREARDWSARTGGAFDPAVGALVDAWDLRGAGRVPDGFTLARARRATGLGRFAWDDGARTASRLDPDAWIDTGGFGKGAALRAVRAALAPAGVTRAVVDFGGQLLVLGCPVEGGGWRVAVAHPVHRSRPAAWLEVRDASVATSGQSERSVRAGAARLGHILDPRSGRPAPAWGSVTVVDPDPLAADVLATALFVLGPDAGLRWAEAEGVAALFLLPDGDRLEQRASSRMRPHFRAPLPVE